MERGVFSIMENFLSSLPDGMYYVVDSHSHASRYM